MSRDLINRESRCYQTSASLGFFFPPLLYINCHQPSVLFPDQLGECRTFIYLAPTNVLGSVHDGQWERERQSLPSEHSSQKVGALLIDYNSCGFMQEVRSLFTSTCHCPQWCLACPLQVWFKALKTCIWWPFQWTSVMRGWGTEWYRAMTLRLHVRRVERAENSVPEVWVLVSTTLWAKV